MKAGADAAPDAQGRTMKVTRDVIYDLLPAYFAGEVSDDTRALVDAYFQTDPEFARMATRFQNLIADRHRDGGGAEAVRERETFVCARLAAELPQKTRAAALMWGFGSLVAFGVAMLTWNGRMGWANPGIVLGACFAVASLLTFALSFRVKPASRWRGLAGLDDDSLESLGLRRHRGGRARLGI